MSDLYGTVRGSAKTAATRQGTKASGLRTTAETWTAKVEVDLLADGTCEVTLMEKSARFGRTLWKGNIDEEVRDGV